MSARAATRRAVSLVIGLGAAWLVTSAGFAVAYQLGGVSPLWGLSWGWTGLLAVLGWSSARATFPPVPRPYVPDWADEDGDEGADGAAEDVTGAEDDRDAAWLAARGIRPLPELPSGPYLFEPYTPYVPPADGPGDADPPGPPTPPLWQASTAPAVRPWADRAPGDDTVTDPVFPVVGDPAAWPRP